jgi:RNA polymerase sigma-70 factor (ECF subfamily)
VSADDRPHDDQAVYQQLLVVRAQLGDRSALTELVARWERRLLYYIRRLIVVEDDARQLLQEVWVKMINSIGSLHDPVRLAPWLYALARYTVIDHLRDSCTRRQLLSNLPTDPADDESTDPIATFDDAEQVHHGLAQLSIVDREVLTLYFLDDLSVADVAQVLNIPVGTVKSRLYHARRALAAVLAPSQGTDR